MGQYFLNHGGSEECERSVAVRHPSGRAETAHGYDGSAYFDSLPGVHKRCVYGESDKSMSGNVKGNNEASWYSPYEPGVRTSRVHVEDQTSLRHNIASTNSPGDLKGGFGRAMSTKKPLESAARVCIHDHAAVWEGIRELWQRHTLHHRESAVDKGAARAEGLEESEGKGVVAVARPDGVIELGDLNTPEPCDEDLGDGNDGSDENGHGDVLADGCKGWWRK